MKEGEETNSFISKAIVLCTTPTSRATHSSPVVRAGRRDDVAVRACVLAK
jgi:hypothetical protein